MSDTPAYRSAYFELIGPTKFLDLRVCGDLDLDQIDGLRAFLDRAERRIEAAKPNGEQP